MLSAAFCLLTAVAGAQDVQPAEPVLPAADAGTPPHASAASPTPAAPEAHQTLEDQWADAGPSRVLDDAVERRGFGDFVGADARMAWLQAHHDSSATRYHRAVSLELQERYQDAEALYGSVATDFPTAPEARDARFRRALCLEDLHRHKEALALVRGLQKEGGWSNRDRVSLSLEQGVTQLRRGKTRRGIRQVTTALGEAEAIHGIKWMRAKAHTALARHLLDEAAEVEQRNDRRAKKNLTVRSGHILDAERQVISVARLGETEYALEGLLLLGDAYLAFYDDLLAAPLPRSLTPEQAEIYENSLRKKVSTLRAKAYRYYDEGVALAVRSQWQGSRTEDLKTRRAALGE